MGLKKMPSGRQSLEKNTEKILLRTKLQFELLEHVIVLVRKEINQARLRRKKLPNMMFRWIEEAHAFNKDVLFHSGDSVEKAISMGIKVAEHLEKCPLPQSVICNGLVYSGPIDVFTYHGFGEKPMEFNKVIASPKTTETPHRKDNLTGVIETQYIGSLKAEEKLEKQKQRGKDSPIAEEKSLVEQFRKLPKHENITRIADFSVESRKGKRGEIEELPLEEDIINTSDVTVGTINLEKEELLYSENEAKEFDMAELSRKTSVFSFGDPAAWEAQLLELDVATETLTVSHMDRSGNEQHISVADREESTVAFPPIKSEAEETNSNVGTVVLLPTREPAFTSPEIMSVQSIDSEVQAGVMRRVPSAEIIPLEDEFRTEAMRSKCGGESTFHSGETEEIHQLVEGENQGDETYGGTPEMEGTTVFADQTGNSSQLKSTDHDVNPILTMAISVNRRLASFLNLQLQIFHFCQSPNTYSIVKDSRSEDFLFYLLDYLVLMREIVQSGEKQLMVKLNQETFSQEAGSLSSILPRKIADISMWKDAILGISVAGLDQALIEEKLAHSRAVVWIEISSLPDYPNCPDLKVLLLQKNRSLRKLTEFFFSKMPSLQVLDLSETGLRSLPSSLFKLTALEALLLRDCANLDGLLPDIGDLQNMKVLDLKGTELYDLPDGISKLSKLEFLRVCFYGASDPSEYSRLCPVLITHSTISKFQRMKALSIIVHPSDWRWNNSADALTNEVGSLHELTYLQFYFTEVGLVELFMRISPSWKNRTLCKFKFVVGQDIDRIVSRVPDKVVSEFDKHDRCLRYVNGSEVPAGFAGLLVRVTAFYLDHHYVMKNLSEFGHQNFKELKFCVARECPDMVEIINNGDGRDSVLPHIQHLSLHYLWKLECFWKGAVPQGSLACLAFLSVNTCHKIEALFTQSVLHCFKNLKELTVEDCASLKVIIRREEDPEEVEGRNLFFPSMMKLNLHHLPELINIWLGSCALLKPTGISIYDCPKAEQHSDIG